MDVGYALTPFVAWFFAGTFKFLVNSIRFEQIAFKQIGYGGFPSNHSAIVTSAAALVALREGIGHPAFGVAVALAFVVILDAYSLRRQVGRQAQAINQLSPEASPFRLRQQMGHTPVEIAGGIIVGIFSALFVEQVVPWIFQVP